MEPFAPALWVIVTEKADYRSGNVILILPGFHWFGSSGYRFS